MLTSDFDYQLPEERIAQAPMQPRDACRLMVMDRATGALEHRVFRDIIDYLDPGDLLVLNETRVLPARLLGEKQGTGGRAEVFLLRQRVPDQGDGRAQWEALVRPGKRLKPQGVVEFRAADDPAGPAVLEAHILDWVPGGSPGERLVELRPVHGTLDEAVHAVGKTPLPPYIRGYRGDPELYQTVYARNESSAAAPTAGLHFTDELLGRIGAKGVGLATVELEIGLDTFRIVEERNAEDHQMHTETIHVGQQAIDAIEATHARGNRVVAVGTTTMRSLESAWDADLGALRARDGEPTSLFILPGYEFHVVDALVTNFHVPRSTLMMLVSAFSTRQNVLAAYSEAIGRGYRMLSFGDAMLII